jgi:hypothetical protein
MIQHLMMVEIPFLLRKRLPVSIVGYEDLDVWSPFQVEFLA